ncbi:hypothetical protein MNJPNG_04910 [Cupriavidus oxalaticus]|uniref:hypothetical protein n=1 Tax=Cupriavidus oxalaticus TaxID=96344 RepID=UPI003F737302
MTNANILWLIVGLMLGGGISFLAMCLVALGKIGDDPLPEIDAYCVPKSPIPRED